MRINLDEHLPTILVEDLVELGQGFRLSCQGMDTAAPTIAPGAPPILPLGLGNCVEEKALETSAWYCFNSKGVTHPVGGKAANGWGLFDMLGNAGEWLNDPPLGKALPGPLTDPGDKLTEASDLRDWRNCSYNGPPSACRVASTLFGTPSNHGPGVGFRLVRTRTD